jgi:AP-1 complex subunit gamma-1
MAGYDATPSSAAAGGSVDPLADLMGGLSTQPAVGSSASGDPFAAMGSSIGGAAAPSPVDPLGDLMGMGAPAPTSAPTPAAFADPLSDLMGMGAPAAPPPPMNAAGSSPAATTLVAFSKDGVEVSFECTKPDVTDHSLTTVVATTRNLGGTPMTGYVLQCAVPKTMSLAMRTASGGELPVGGVVTQRLDVTNSQHGEKALAMRLRLAWNAGGAAVVEQATVNFPAGL